MRLLGAMARATTYMHRPQRRRTNPLALAVGSSLLWLLAIWSLAGETGSGIRSVTAACPGGCSGHGTCFNGTTCNCAIGWLDVDCSRFALLSTRLSNNPANQFWIYWTYTASTIYIQLDGLTANWISILIGYDTDANAGMQDADCWWFAVNDVTGAVTYGDTYSVNTLGIPITDTQNDLFAVSGYQSGSGSSTRTTVNFARLLISPDTSGLDRDITSASMGISYGLGISDVFAFHDKQSRGKIPVWNWLQPLYPNGPSAPATLYYNPAAASTATNLKVVYSASQYSPTSAILNYYIEIDNAGNSVFSPAVTNGPATLTASITGLTASTTYNVRVKAVNSQGSSAWTTVTLATPAASTSVPTTPATPINGGMKSFVFGNTFTRASLVLFWSPPASWNGYPCVGYTLAITGGYTNTLTLPCFPLSFNLTTFPVLLNAPSISHSITIAAISEVGSSSPSAPLSVTSPAMPPCPGSPVQCSNHGTCNTITSYCKCQVGWLGNDCSIRAMLSAAVDPKYSLYWMYDLTYVYFQIVANTTGWVGLMINRGLSNGANQGDTWVFSAIDTSPFGLTSADMFSVDLNTPGGPNNDPHNTFLTGLAGNQIGSGTTAQTIINFQRIYDTGDAVYNRKIVNGTLACSWAFGVADAYAQHTPTNRGKFDMEILQPYGAPSVPTALNQVIATTSSITIGWSKPVYQISQPTQNYTISVNGVVNATVSGGLSPLQFTLTGLPPSTSFTFAIRASNIFGSSPFSAGLVATTLTPAATPPSTPAAPTLNTAAPTSLIVDWVQPALNGAPFISYTLTIFAPSPVTTVTGLTSPTYTLTGLNPSTAYTFSVICINQAGPSAASANATFSTLAFAPCPGTPQCSGHGTCVQSVCHCAASYLSADCSILAPFSLSTDPAFTLYYVADSQFTYFQIVAQTNYWVGLILNYGPLNGMDKGDCWWFTVDTSQPVGSQFTAVDGYSPDEVVGSVPTTDLQNDLLDASGHRPVAGVTIANWKRAFVTTDTSGKDQNITAGATNTLSWAAGLSLTYTQHGPNPSDRGKFPGTYDLRALPPTGPPAAPTGLNVFAASLTTLSASWVAPSFYGAKPVTNYTLAFKLTSAGGNPVPVATVPAGTTTYVFTGLTQSTSYDLAVRAVSPAGAGAYCASVSALTLSPAATPPSTPAAPTLNTATPVSLSVDWVQPALNGAPFVSYTLKISGPGVSTTVTGLTKHNYTLTGLTASSNYTFSVICRNQAGSSSPSANATFSTPAFPPCPGTPQCSGHGTCFRSVCQCAQTWLGADCSMLAPFSISTNPIFTLYYVADSQFTYFQIAAQTPYWVGLILNYGPINGMDKGDCWYFTVDPAQPVGSQFTAVDAYSPDELAGSIPTTDAQNDLLDTSGHQPGGGWTIVNWKRAFVTTDSSGKDKDITAGVTNTISWSIGLSLAFVQHGPNPTDRDKFPGLYDLRALMPTGPPAAPTGLAVFAATQTSLSVSWVAPTLYGAQPVSNFTLAIKLSSAGGSPVPVATVPAGTTTYVFTGLTQLTSYNFSVRAVSPSGAGPYCFDVTAFTLSPAATPPSTPAAPTLNTAAPTSLIVDWVQPALNGALFVSYTLTISAPSPVTSVTGLTSPTYTLTGLNPSTAYTFSVVCINQAGSSAASSGATFSTIAFAPCPGTPQCSGQGTCVQSVCHCDQMYLGADCSMLAPYSISTNPAFTLYYVADSQFTYFQIAAQTTYWVGLILNYGPLNAMDRADCWWFTVDTTKPVGSQFTAIDGYSPDEVVGSNPTADAQNDLLDTSGHQPGNGMTIVNWKRAFTTTDSSGKDKAITAGVTNKLSWSIGQSLAYSQHGPNPTDRDKFPGMYDLRVLAPTGPPAAPGSFGVFAASLTTLSVSWVAPTYTGAKPVANYTVAIKLSSAAGSPVPFVTLPSSARTYVFTGLVNTTSYDIAVRATSAAGAGPFTAVTTAQTLSPSAQAPAQPSPITLWHAGPTFLVLNWTLPNLYGVALSQPNPCFVETSTDGSTFSTLYRGAELSYTVANLVPSTRYWFRLTVSNLVGASPVSPLVTFNTSSFACPNGCSGFGVCQANGACDCDADHLGDDCHVGGLLTQQLTSAGSSPSGLEVSWSIPPLSADVYFRVKWTGQVWASIGWGGDPIDGMTDDDMIALFVKQHPITGLWIVDCQDQYATGQFVPLVDFDETQDCKNAAVVHDPVSGLNSVTFQRKLVTNDPGDKPFVDSLMSVTWALGQSNTYSQHTVTDRGKLFLNFYTGEAEHVPEHEYWTPLLPVAVAFVVVLLGAVILRMMARRRTVDTASDSSACSGHFPRRVLYGRMGASPAPTRRWIDVFTLDLASAVADATAGEVAVVVAYVLGMAAYCGLMYIELHHSQRALIYMLGELNAIHLMLSTIVPLRNSLLLPFFGLSFERAIKFHRWVSRVTFSMMTAHGLTMFDKFGLTQLFQTQSTAIGLGNIWGVVAYFAFVVAMMFHWEFFRRRAFELFWFTHLFAFVGVALSMIHSTLCLYLLITPCVFYVIDHSLRAWNGYRTTLMVQAVAFADGVTKLTLQQTGFRYKAGQFVFVQIPAISRWEWHPFTISSSFRGGENEPFTLHITSAGTSALCGTGAGSWTGLLHALATGNKLTPSPKGAPAKVSIDGPYGSWAVPFDDEQRTTLVLVAGGIGVTPLISLYTELYDRARAGSLGSVNSVHLHWICPSREPFDNWFAATNSAGIAYSGLAYLSSFVNERFVLAGGAVSSFRISLYSTGSGGDKSRTKLFTPKSADAIEGGDLPHAIPMQVLGRSTAAAAASASAGPRPVTASGTPGIDDSAVAVIVPVLSPDDAKQPPAQSSPPPQPQQLLKVAECNGRPDIDLMIRSATASDQSLAVDRDAIAVYACGPDSMMRAVRSATHRYGVALHTETFLF